MRLKTKDFTENCTSTNRATEITPRKTEGSGKCVGGSPAAAACSARRGADIDGVKGGDCALCKKYLTNFSNGWNTTRKRLQKNQQ